MKRSSHVNQRGFSLVELMIAMLLGLILIAGVVSVFVSSSQTYRLQESLFRVQESGRFALELLRQDLAGAGFQDVLPDTAERDLSIVAVRGIAQASPPAGLVTPVSDILRINPGVGAPVHFYLAVDTSGERALFRNGDAMVEGVEQIRFQYGVDTDNDNQVDTFSDRTAVTAAQWPLVRAVRVDMLVSGGDNNVVETAQAPAAPFAAVNTADRRLYHVFTTTVSLRNKLP